MAEIHKGGNASIPNPGDTIVVRVRSNVPVDAVAILADNGRRALHNDAAVFYDLDSQAVPFNPADPREVVRWSQEGSEQLFTIPASSIREGQAVRIAVQLDDTAPGVPVNLGGAQITATIETPNGGGETFTVAAEQLTTEKCAVVADLYSRNGAVKIRNESQGWQGGFVDLLVEHGIAVAGVNAPEVAPTAPPATSLTEPAAAARAETPEQTPQQALSLLKNQGHSLTKKDYQDAVLTLVKHENPSMVGLVKLNMDKAEKAQVPHTDPRKTGIILDTSGSMEFRERAFYTSGQMTQLLRRLVAHAVKENPLVKIPVWGFDAEATFLGYVDLANVDTFLDGVHERLGLNTLYAKPLDLAMQYFFESDYAPAFAPGETLDIFFVTDGNAADPGPAAKVIDRSTNYPGRIVAISLGPEEATLLKQFDERNEHDPAAPQAPGSPSAPTPPQAPPATAPPASPSRGGLGGLLGRRRGARRVTADLSAILGNLAANPPAARPPAAATEGRGLVDNFDYQHMQTPYEFNDADFADRLNKEYPGWKADAAAHGLLNGRPAGRKFGQELPPELKTTRTASTTTNLTRGLRF